MLLWEPFKGIKWSGFKKSEISLLFRVMDKVGFFFFFFLLFPTIHSILN